MKTTLTILFLILSLFCTVNGQSLLTNDDVVAMVNSGLSPAIIAAKIRSSDAHFDTTTEGLKKLADAKVPDSVVVAMIERDAAQKDVAKQASKESNATADPIPEQGALADIKGKTKIYILTSDVKSRDKIIKELDKKKLFEVVDSIEKSDFVLKFEAWEETRNAVANTYGNPNGATTTVNTNNVRIGVLTVFMPSATANRIRLVYSAKETQRSVLFDHPAESTTKDFVKAFEKMSSQ